VKKDTNRREFLKSSAAAAASAIAVPAVAKSKTIAKNPIRAGLIGLDTSHVIAFTRYMNKPGVTDARADVEIVAGVPAGSPDMPRSANRIEGYTKQLREERGVEIVESIGELLEKVDAVLLTSVDGRPHLAQIRPVLEAGKPVFLDKPAAADLAEVIKIYRLAEKHDVPIFSSSSRRFNPRVRDACSSDRVGEAVGCDVFSQVYGARHHSEIWFTGMHGVEILYRVLSPGCKSVTCVETDRTYIVTGSWDDGRIGVWRAIRTGHRDSGKGGYGVAVFGTQGITASGLLPQYIDYEPLVVAIAEFFKTGKPPVAPEETIELYAFLEAAERSKRQASRPVLIADVLRDAVADPEVHQLDRLSSTPAASCRW
jgi:hypothetical protein